MFYETTDSDRRQYIGNHLSDKNELPSNYKRLWTFLDVIRDNKVLSQQFSLFYDSIEVLEQVSQDRRDRTAVKLFVANQGVSSFCLFALSLPCLSYLLFKELFHFNCWLILQQYNVFVKVFFAIDSQSSNKAI